MVSAGVPPPASAYVQSIVIDRTAPETLYLASPGAGLYRSTDGAENWTDIRPAADLHSFYAVVIDPLAPARILSGGEASGLWISPDRGETWEPAGLSGISILDIAVDPTDSGRVFLLTPEGVYSTGDLSAPDWRLVFDYATFQRENRQPDWPDDSWLFTRFQKITIDPHAPRTVMVGARWEGGMHRSDDGGRSWTHQKISEIFRRVDLVAFDPAASNIFYAATHHQGLFKSYNRGRSWVPASRGLEPQRRTPHYGALLIDGLAFSPENTQVIYAGSDYSNWKTTDGGSNWQELGIDLTCEFARSFAVSPADPQEVYAGTNVGLYRSTDGGRTWASANRGLPERTILDSVVVDIGDEAFEYAAVRGRPPLFRRSLTHGGDWISMSWLLWEDATSIGFDSDGGELVLQTEKEERRSSDGGFRWDVPSVEYAPKEIAEPELPSLQEDGDGLFQLRVVIRGAVLPDDRLVDSLYQRPPFISLQIVTPAYPLDRSEPLWSACWDHRLSGVLGIPADLSQSVEGAYLYVEVRDFQHGTLSGAIPLRFSEGEIAIVPVSSAHSLLDGE